MTFSSLDSSVFSYYGAETSTVFIGWTSIISWSRTSRLDRSAWASFTFYRRACSFALSSRRSCKGLKYCNDGIVCRLTGSGFQPRAMSGSKLNYPVNSGIGGSLKERSERGASYSRSLSTTFFFILDWSIILTASWILSINELSRKAFMISSWDALRAPRLLLLPDWP